MTERRSILVVRFPSSSPSGASVLLELETLRIVLRALVDLFFIVIGQVRTLSGVEFRHVVGEARKDLLEIIAIDEIFLLDPLRRLRLRGLIRATPIGAILGRGATTSATTPASASFGAGALIFLLGVSARASWSFVGPARIFS